MKFYCYACRFIDGFMKRITPPLSSGRNVMSDFSGEVMAEVLAERALVRPQIIPLVPLTNQYHMDLKDYKSKVSAAGRDDASTQFKH